MHKTLVFAFFLLLLYAGFRVSVDSWDGQIFVYMGENRAPASVRKLGDYEPLDRKALFSSAHRQLLNHASASIEEAFVKVSLGHPLLKTSWGSEFACPVEGHAGLFDRVELTFIGVGIAEGGEPPKMVIETDCLPGENLNSLAPIWIPMREIASQPAKDREMNLAGEHPMNVRLIQIPSSWPEQWALWNVKLFRQTRPEDALDFGSAKLREANSKLLTFDWK
jgi:hypothetical protein